MSASSLIADAENLNAPSDTRLMVWVISIMLAASAATLGYAYGSPLFEAMAPYRLVVLLILPLCLTLLWRQRVRTAASLLIWGQWLVSLDAIFHNGGLHGPLILVMPIQVASAAWLLGVRSAVLIALLNSGFMLALHELETRGWLPGLRFQHESAPYLVVLTNMAIALCIALFSRQSYQRERERAQATRQAWRAHDEELHKLVSLIEQCPIAIAITDAQRRIEYVNRAFIGRSGLNSASFRNLPADLVSTPGLSPQQSASLRQAMAQGQTWRGEQSLLKPDGHRAIEEIEIGPIRRTDGEISHWFELKQDITAKRWAAERIDRLVYIDALTQLPNRAALLDRLVQELSTPGLIWHLLAIRMDGLGQLNGLRGPEAGDACLQQVAHHLIQALTEVRPNIFRLGGSEFIVLFPPHVSPAEVDSCAERAYLSLTAYAGQPTASLSAVRVLLAATHLSSDEDDPLSQSLRRASLALRQARHEAPGRPCWYGPGLGRKAQGRVLTRRSIGLATLERWLTLDVRERSDPDGQCCGHWAGLCWMPGAGPLAPLLEVARRAELNFELDETLIAELARWQGRLLSAEPARPLTLALLTPLLAQDHAVTWLMDCLHRHAYQGPAPALVLHTQDLARVASDPDPALRRLKALREAGFRLCLKDVGLGYPGVLELATWPVQEWLLTPSLLQRPADGGAARALLAALVAAARSMDMPLVVEGEVPAFLKEAAPQLIVQATRAAGAAWRQRPDGSPDEVNSTPV